MDVKYDFIMPIRNVVKTFQSSLTKWHAVDILRITTMAAPGTLTHPAGYEMESAKTIITRAT